MKKIGVTLSLCALLLSCGTSSPSGGAGTQPSLDGSSSSGSGGSSSSGAVGSSGPGSSGSSGGSSSDQVKAWAEAYKAANPGNGGKDWDIVSCCTGASRTAASLAADPAAQQLRSICGSDQLPVIPLLAWEYGGADHPWINPQASALVYCVYIPANPPSAHWTFDSAAMRVTADVYVRFQDQNPCNGQQGAQQVMACLGDPTNIEILVDTASYHDGADVGLSLSNAATDLNLILPDGTKVLLYHGV